MTTMKINKILIGISIIVSLIGCSKSPGVVDPEIACGGSMLIARVEGDNFSAADELVTAKLTPSGLINTLVITGACASSVAGQASSESIGLVVAFDDIDDFAEGATILSAEEGPDSVIGQYINGSATLVNAEAIIASSQNNNGDAIFRITSLNTTTQVISAEFNFIALDEENNQIYSITNGRTSNVPYTIE